MVAKNKAIFLDRDGVIINTNIYWSKPFAITSSKDLKFDNYARKGINLFKKFGFKIIIITNQPDIASKKSNLYELNKIHKRIYEFLRVDEISICFHSKYMNCRCRKPKPKLVLDAIKKYNIDLNQSFLIGDRKSDIDLGVKLNIKSLFINYGYIEAKPKGQIVSIKSFEKAVNYIMSNTHLYEK